MQKAIIKGGESLSNTISLWNCKHIGLVVPSGWSTAGMTFKVGGGNFSLSDLHDGDGEYSRTITGGESISLPVDLFAPWRSMAIRSGTSDTPVEQAGQTASKVVVDFGDDKTLTITSGIKGTRGDRLSVSFEMNDEDTLDVTNPEGGEILVKLADTMASKNTAALIENGIQALSTVDGVDVSALTAAGSTEYNAAPPTGMKATSVLTLGGEKTLTFTYQLGGAQGNGIPIRVENNTEDTLAVSAPEDGGMLVKLATTTASKNTDTAIQTAVRALTVENYSVDAMTVEGSTAYDAAPVAGTKAVCTLTAYDVDVEENYTSLGALTITSGVVGPDGGPLLHNLVGTVEINTSDDLAIVEGDLVEGLPNITLKLANETPSKNAAAAIETLLKTVTCPDYAAHISGLTVAADATWTTLPPVAFDVPDKQTVNGTWPIAAAVEGVTSSGAYVPDIESQDLADGMDCEILVYLKE